MKYDNRTNNYLQNTTQKTEDCATRTVLKTDGELECSGRVSSSCSTNNNRHVTFKRHEHDQIWKYKNVHKQNMNFFFINYCIYNGQKYSSEQTKNITH